MLRIIAGVHRSRKLARPPENLKEIRPTKDKAREAMFSILSHRLGEWDGVVVCDAFCGTGALGLEALSRGAEKIYHLDTHPVALSLVRENIALLKAEKACQVLKADAVRPPAAPKACHVLLLDPPYHQGLAEKALAALTEKGWAARGAFAAIEIAREEALTPPINWTVLDDRTRDAARLLLLQYQA